MNSIRSKVTLLTIAAILVSIISVGVTSLVSIKKEENASANKQMEQICDNQEKELDAYLNSIEKSVTTVSRFAEEDLQKDDVNLKDHLALVGRFFRSIADNTDGVTTYFYRIDPDYSKDEKGYWYTRYGTQDFEKHKVTPLENADSQDPSEVSWFTIPKEEGKAVWIDPYDNEKLGVRMVSYVSPVYQKGKFVGVIGMDIAYPTLVDQVKNTKIYQSGYVFLTDRDGRIIYHPDVDMGTSIEKSMENVTDLGTNGDETFISYTVGGEKKRAAWTTLANGMRIYVTVPEAEISAGWRHLFMVVIGTSIVLLALFILLAALFARRITDPLQRLTEAAEEVKQGNYDVKLDYTGTDEVGTLTAAFRQLTSHLKVYISDLNSKTYFDPVTRARNKMACDVFMRKMQDTINKTPDGIVKFAVCRFNCDDLVPINDEYGKSKGNANLIMSYRYICSQFRRSAVFRLTGGEFAVFLQGKDYVRRQELMNAFDRNLALVNAKATEPWDRMSFTHIITEYDQEAGEKVTETFYRSGDMLRDARGLPPYEGLHAKS
ncbi:MAG: HAMP domain-containing protein [Firmicutes bacterium]|nr:HAMP domain-containing protein [Bacillota bacterium]